MNLIIDSLFKNFTLKSEPWIKHSGYENKGNDYRVKKLVIENSLENMLTDIRVLSITDLLSSRPQL